MSVTKNLTLGRQPRRFGLISWRAARELAAQAARAAPPRHRCRATARLLFRRDPTTRGDRARARGRHSPSRARRADREPRRAPRPRASSRSFAISKRAGLAIVFITHFIEQVYAIADRIIGVAQRPTGRRGPHRGAPAAEADPDDAGAGTPGRPNSGRPAPPSARAGEPILVAEGLGKARVMQPFDLSMRRGRSASASRACSGSGRTEVAKLIFGAMRRRYGTP